MAISTAITTLSYESAVAGTFTKLCDITSYPDTGSAPSLLDSTTLSAEKYKTNIFGLQEAPEMSFEANYDENTLIAINNMANTVKNWKLSFGDLTTTTLAGEDGTFTWSGMVTAYANGAGVDEVRKMTIIVSCESGLTFA